jgi:hypothetical protein
MYLNSDVTRLKKGTGFFFRLAALVCDRNVPRKPRLVGGVKGHNMSEISFPGSPALIWAGSFTEITCPDWQKICAMIQLAGCKFASP